MVEGQARRAVGEAAAAKVKRAPDMPTRLEFEEHQATHEPYRSWCPACVAGSGRAEYHKRVDHSEDAVATVGVDYGYMGDGDEGDNELPALADPDLERKPRPSCVERTVVTDG